MKTQKIYTLICLVILMTGWISAQGQNQWEVPGDNFSLEGALELFRKSNSPQEFEQMLNNPDSKVNNLDLNGDGYIDYIRVIDLTEKKVHVFIIQAVISERELQDVAVITLKKLANGKAVLQITGDEDIYGVETIIEPTQEVYTHGGTISTQAGVNVWFWPSVQFIYGPHYSVWASPWGWNYRPVWWRTWRPVVYHDYYAYWSPYRRYYAPCYTHRVEYAHHIYRQHRTSSVIVHSRHNRHITHYRSTRIDTKGRHQGERSGSRQTSSSVRYDTNGRISTRSSTSTRSQQPTIEDGRSSSRTRNTDAPSNRSASEIRSGSNSSVRRSSEVRKIETSKNRSGASNRISPQRESSSPRMGNNGSSGSNQRSTSNNTVRQSAERTSGNSNVQRSSGSSKVQRSTSRPNVQRSSVNSGNKRSSGSSNIQRSSGSSKVQRSSVNSGNKRSSGSSNVQRSSGSSKVQKSSGSSGNKRSSGSSGSSNTQRSGGSSSKGRGRQ